MVNQNATVLPMGNHNTTVLPMVYQNTTILPKMADSNEATANPVSKKAN